MKHRMTVTKSKEKTVSPELWKENSEHLSWLGGCGLAAPSYGCLISRTAREYVSLVLSYTFCDDVVHQPQECSAWSLESTSLRGIAKASYIQVVSNPQKCPEQSTRKHTVETWSNKEYTNVYLDKDSTTFLRQLGSRPLLLLIILKI